MDTTRRLRICEESWHKDQSWRGHDPIAYYGMEGQCPLCNALDTISDQSQQITILQQRLQRETGGA